MRLLRPYFHGVLILMPCLALFVSGPAAASESLAITGDWAYSMQKGAESNSLAQRYGMDWSQALEITDTMSASGAARYFRNQDESRTNDLLSPSMSFLIQNDLFQYTLSGTANHRYGEENIITSDRTWQTSLASGWVRPLLPDLQVSFGQNENYDNRSPHGLDSETTHGEASIDWDLGPLKAYYSHFRQRYEDGVGLGRGESTSHLARLEAQTSMWNNRLTVSIANLYSQSDSTNRVAAGQDGIALVPVQVLQVSAGRDDTPEETELLPVVSGLADRNRFDPALTLEIGQPVNIALQVDFQEVGLIYFYTDDDISVFASSFRWEYYVSGDGLLWNRVEGAVSHSYNLGQRRLEILPPTATDRYIKLVAVSTPAISVSFSEVEAFLPVAVQGAAFTSNSDSYSNQTDASLGMRLSGSLGATYSFSYEHGTYTSGLDFDRSSHGGRLQWEPSPWFAAGLNGSASRNRNGDDPETQGRSFGLSIFAPPLPSLDVNVGVNRNEAYESDEWRSTITTYSLYMAAAFFPDLDGSFDVSFNEAESWDTDLVTRNLASRIHLTARLTPSLSMDVSGGQVKRLGEAQSRTLEGASTINWRVSDMLSLSASGGRTWQEGEGDGSKTLSFSSSLAPTRVMQLSLGYSYNAQDTVSEATSLSWTWKLGRNMSLQAIGGYQDNEEGNSWSVSSQLNTRMTLR